VVAVNLAVGVGAVAIAPLEVVAILAGQLGIATPWPYTDQQESVLMAIRIPRLLATALVGAGWACSGVAMQGLYRTALGDPALVGIGAGAALGGALGAGAVVAIGVVAQPSGTLLVTAAAVLAALGAAGLVHRVASVSGRVVVATMLLAGLVLSALLAALTAFVVAAGRVPEMGSLAFWTLGSFAGVVGLDVVIAALVVLPSVLVLARLGPRLDALALGEAEAAHLGVDVRGAGLAVTLTMAALVGVAVAVAGVIAFVGLMVPSLVRAWVGRPHRVVAVGSALLGATVLVVADVVARSLFSPVELSVGVLTTLVGAPFFLILLLRDRGLLAR
jgi:iron complex transport system permease protein